MHYVKCSHCGKFNEVKTEFQTFCDHCGGKLEGNYTNWKKRNPQGKFEDFLENECLSEAKKKAEEEALSAKPQKRISPLLLVVAILILGISALGIVGYFVKPYLLNYVTKFANDHQDEIFSSLNTKNWETYTCGNLGLSLQSPIPLTEAPEMKNGVPDQYKHIIADMDIYTMENPILQMVINATSTLYQEGVETSVDNAKVAILRQLQSVPANMNFTSNDQNYQLDGSNGVLTSGTFTTNNTAMALRLLTVSKGLKIWQIMVVFEANDSGTKTAEKVIKSVKINTM